MKSSEDVISELIGLVLLLIIFGIISLISSCNEFSVNSANRHSFQMDGYQVVQIDGMTCDGKPEVYWLKPVEYKEYDDKNHATIILWTAEETSGQVVFTTVSSRGNFQVVDCRGNSETIALLWDIDIDEGSEAIHFRVFPEFELNVVFDVVPPVTISGQGGS